MRLEKKCGRCGETKPLSEFYFDKGWGKYQANCKACSRQAVRQWRLDNLAYRRDYDAAKRLGIDLAQYKNIRSGFAERCHGCGKQPNLEQNEPRLAIDHDHATGKVRGLLCHGCNLAIGNAYDNPALLRRLADYLEEANAKQDLPLLKERT